MTDLQYLRELHKIDYVSIPHVETVDDLKEVAKRLHFLDGAVLLARVDDKRGLEDFWAVCEASGGIILNRAGLQVSYNADKLFKLNKFFMEQCNILGTPMIVESELMDSMLTMQVPHRKEVADLQASLLDGADVVHLT